MEQQSTLLALNEEHRKTITALGLVIKGGGGECPRQVPGTTGSSYHYGLYEECLHYCISGVLPHLLRPLWLVATTECRTCKGRGMYSKDGIGLIPQLDHYFNCWQCGDNHEELYQTEAPSAEWLPLARGIGRVPWDLTYIESMPGDLVVQYICKGLCAAMEWRVVFDHDETGILARIQKPKLTPTRSSLSSYQNIGIGHSSDKTESTWNAFKDMIERACGIVSSD